MKDYLCEDTIAAISTPIGKGAISIVRISGRDALGILKSIFRTKKGTKKASFEDKKLNYGFIVDESDERVDEVLASYMKAPKTFTGEDIVEINTHGGMAVARKVLQLVLNSGARLAKPGEFSMRAFLNGRIDLVQAEAINDMINAKTVLSAKVALRGLEGKTSKTIEDLRKKLVTVKAYIEASIDFPDEEVEILKSSDISGKLTEVRNGIDNLIMSYKEGRLIREGIKAVIVGRPNVGKSSLLNTLLNEERAIVTEIPGTTRDVIEETITINGIPTILIDTAGIRESNDRIERLGIEKSRKYLKQADIVLFMIDGSADLTDDDKALMELIKGKANAILVINKKDKGLKLTCSDFDNFKKCIEISAKNGSEIQSLKEMMADEAIGSQEVNYEEPIITNERQKRLLEKASKAISIVIERVDRYESPDLLCADLDEAIEPLNEITGNAKNEELYDIIFSKFCIGK